MRNILIGLGLFLIFILVIAIALRFTRSFPPYHPGENPPITAWGSVEPEMAIELQAMLDDRVNKLCRLLCARLPVKPGRELAGQKI